MNFSITKYSKYSVPVTQCFRIIQQEKDIGDIKKLGMKGYGF